MYVLWWRLGREKRSAIEFLSLISLHIINIFNGNKQLLGIDEPTAAFVFVDLSFNNWIYKKIIMAKVVVTTKDGLDCLSDPFSFLFLRLLIFICLKKSISIFSWLETRYIHAKNNPVQYLIIHNIRQIVEYTYKNISGWYSLFPIWV